MDAVWTGKGDVGREGQVGGLGQCVGGRRRVDGCEGGIGGAVGCQISDTLRNSAFSYLAAPRVEEDRRYAATIHTRKLR